PIGRWADSSFRLDHRQSDRLTSFGLWGNPPKTAMVLHRCLLRPPLLDRRRDQYHALGLEHRRRGRAVQAMGEKCLDSDPRLLVVAVDDVLIGPLCEGLDHLGWTTLTGRSLNAAEQVLKDM